MFKQEFIKSNHIEILSLLNPDYSGVEDAIFEAEDVLSMKGRVGFQGGDPRTLSTRELCEAKMEIIELDARLRYLTFRQELLEIKKSISVLTVRREALEVLQQASTTAMQQLKDERAFRKRTRDVEGGGGGASGGVSSGTSSTFSFSSFFGGSNKVGKA